MKTLPRLVVLALLVTPAVLGCQSSERCVPGDQVACQCGDGTYGYRTCALHSPAAGYSFGGCDCVVGLSPDAGRLSSPYTSGRGTGGGGTDGGTDGGAD